MLNVIVLYATRLPYCEIDRRIARHSHAAFRVELLQRAKLRSDETTQHRERHRLDAVMP